MARVLWIGDAGSHTGFATVTHAIAPKLVERGHDISVLALNYPGDYSPECVGLKLYRANTTNADIFGARRVVELVRKVQPDVTVVLHDPRGVWLYLFDNPFDVAGELLDAAPVLAYLPVDGYDYPPAMVDDLVLNTNVVTMSRHGQRTFRGSKLVFHGVDQDRFWPVAERPVGALKTKRECKEALGHDPDAFLVVRVDKNSGRKDFAATISAVGPVLERHRDMRLHLHAMQDAMMPGVDMNALLTRHDLAPGQVTITGTENSIQAWPQERLHTLYNAADVFITTSRGEGFGLTIAEALSCGVPVIAQNISAIPEVVGPGGILIDPQRRITTPAGQDNWLADINAFTEALERIYADEALRTELGLAGRKHVAESFHWDYAVDRFHDFITALSGWRASTEATQ